MEEYFVRKIDEVKKNQEQIEEKLKIRLKIIGNKVHFEGSSIDEYEASIVFEAINFGFSPRVALALKDEESAFKVIHIRDHTKRKLRDVQSRLIGKEGKTRRLIAELSDSYVLIKEGEIGIIGDIKNAENASTAIISLIKGSKQSNMYRYLEKKNRIKKEESLNYLIKK